MEAAPEVPPDGPRTPARPTRAEAGRAPGTGPGRLAPGLLVAAVGLLAVGGCVEASSRVVGNNEDQVDDTRRGPAPEARVELHGFPPDDTIPNAAASVVAAPRPSDARVRRFFRDLGAARIELVLSLTELNAGRTNYPFEEDPSWRQMVASVHSVGGTVLLRISDVPRRLRAPGAGDAGPLAGPGAREEWRTIVGEVVGHFARRPETRIDELAGPRSPDRVHVWGPPDEDAESRGRAFAHHWTATSEAAREADPALRVSGPGTGLASAADPWWEGALAEVDAGSPPPFFSVSLPGPTFGPAWDGGVERARTRLGGRGLGDAPLVVSGWGLDRGALPGSLSRSRIEASHLVAGWVRLTEAGVVGTLGRGPGISTPILAGGERGLFVEQDGKLLPTPAFNALRMINVVEVGGRLNVEVTDPELFAMAGIDAADRINVVVTRYRPLDGLSGGGFREQDLSDVRTVRLHVDRLPSAGPGIELIWIDERRGNVWKGGTGQAELASEVEPRQVGPWVTLDLRMPIYSVVLLRLTPV